MKYCLVFHFDRLKTSPEYTRAGVLWKMHAVAKSNRLQRVKKFEVIISIIFKHANSNAIYRLKKFIYLYNISAKIFFKIINTQMSTVALGLARQTLTSCATITQTFVYYAPVHISQKNLINLDIVNIAPGKVYTSCIMC